MVGQSYKTFRAAAIAQIENTKRLPMTEFDKQMAEQMQLPKTAKDYARPVSTMYGPVYAIKDSNYVEMSKNGVEIPESTRRIIQPSLIRIWQSWHPGEKP